MASKVDLVAKIVEKTGASKKDVEKFVAAFEESVVELVRAGNPVRLLGFFTAEKVHREAREAHNPSTGEKIKVPAKSVFKITASKALTRDLNK